MNALERIITIIMIKKKFFLKTENSFFFFWPHNGLHDNNQQIMKSCLTYPWSFIKIRAIVKDLLNQKFILSKTPPIKKEHTHSQRNLQKETLNKMFLSFPLGKRHRAD